jgi:hypothetical protein
MATISITIPNSGPAFDVLADVATRDGFTVTTGTAAQRAAQFQAWLRFRLQQIYREQARPVRQAQAVANLDATIDTEAQTIT